MSGFSADGLALYEPFDPRAHLSACLKRQTWPRWGQLVHHGVAFLNATRHTRGSRRNASQAPGQNATFFEAVASV
jgi:hypothetical protein